MLTVHFDNFIISAGYQIIFSDWEIVNGQTDFVGLSVCSKQKMEVA